MYICRSEGSPARDISSLHAMEWGSGQIEKLLTRRRRRRRRHLENWEIGNSRLSHFFEN